MMNGVGVRINVEPIKRALLEIKKNGPAVVVDYRRFVCRSPDFAG